MDVDEVDSDSSPVRAKAKAGKKKRGAAKEDPKETPAARRQQQQKQNDNRDDDEERDAGDKVDYGVAGDPELVREDDGAIRVGPLYIPPPPPPALTFESGDRPRLIITHIENENFKSYAGKQTLGPFHKSFSSIVGPNGSGKSNVIDSMLFVFGYRAQQIRSKKISVLIHDSERHQDVQSCCVRVFFQEIIDNNKVGESFDKDEEVRVVPESEFSVSRTAFKDNSSHYEVNGKRMPFKEVATLLRRKGIDLDHNRFLILQGEVEQIALMKPKGAGPNDTGMLEYLEDIIGSSRFRQPLELIKERVTELDEHRGEKLNRVKLVEKEKDELEGPMNEAMAFLKMENDIVEKKNIGYQQYLNLCESKMADLEEKKAEYEEGAKVVLEKVNKYETRRKEKEELVREAAAEVETIRKQIEENVETLRKHDVEHSSVKEEMKADNAKRHKLKSLLKQEQEKYEKLQSVPEANAQKITECESLKETLIVQAEEEQAKYDKAVASLNAETQIHQAEKEKLETKLMGLRQDSDKKEADLKEVQNKIGILRSTEEREKAKLEQFRLQLDQTESNLTNTKERAAGLEKNVPAKRKEQQDLQAKLGGYQESERDSRKTLSLLEATLAEKRSSVQATRSRGRVHEALMAEKASGRIPGIFGRLGDLGTIDQAYDVAISNAAAGNLDVIVTDTIETSTACIRFLKDNNLGRGTFFALEKSLHHADRAKAGSTWPENVPRLCDLVRLRDERFRTVFYQYLSDTLVASDIDQGQRIAFGKRRFRVVVTSGEVFEMSGASTGGGNRVLKGLMGTQHNARESDGGQSVAFLERDRAKAEADFHEATRARTEAEHRLSVLAKELQAHDHELERLRVELRALEERRAALKEQIKNQERVLADVKPDQKQLDELGKEETRLQSIFDEAKVGVEEVQFSVQKLNKTIKDIMGGKLKTITKKLDETKQQLEKVKSEITRLQVEVKTATRNIEKSKDKVDGYQTEITEVEEKMRKMKTKLDELVAEADKINKSAEEVRTAEKVKSDALAQLQAAVTALSEKENKCLSEKIKVDQQLQEFDSEIKEQTKGKAHWERELRKLKLREIPGERNANMELKKYELHELEGINLETWQYELNVMEENLSKEKPNLAIIEEYRRKEAQYLERVNELEEITARRDRQRKNQDELRKMRVTEFLDGFYHITGKLKEMYQMITLGGDAELELVDSLDPFSEGIVFSVRPPKKSWKNISNLSGGEKTLSSLALVFALHYYRPTPLYVMDEIDAALDFKNVSIVANYIRERTKNAQFIIVSLRSNMFELADRLVGIYKTYHCTKSVTINPGKIADPGGAVAVAGAHPEPVRAE